MTQIGYYKDSCFRWLTPEIQNPAMVYMLSFDDAGIYIGSTYDIKKRIKGHIYSLKEGKCHNKRLQRAFDTLAEFGVFVLERLYQQKSTMREQFYINLLHPELNETNIASSRTVYNFAQYRKEVFEASSKTQITCPHCGKPLNIRIE